ncbi:MAG: AraC family transcriptional regulator [Planctomycetota bacterium]|nr:AraC family transcriptional regulator [Planctomycetota bacterium]
MTGAPPVPPASVVDFVLAHARVQTNVCSYQQHEHGYEVKPRFVPDYNLIYVTRGRVTWTIDGHPHPLVPGRLVFVPPAVRHHALSQTQRMTLGSVHVEVTLPGGRDVFEMLAPPRQQDVVQGSRLDGYLRAAMDEMQRTNDAMVHLMMPSWGRLIALELLRDNADRGLLAHRPVEPIVLELLRELHSRIERPATLDELARWSGFSGQHLNRVFRRSLGVTPLRYLMRLRMERAAALLADGQWTVRAVATKLGFDDAYYFSRLFRQHMGRSPSRHRTATGSDSPSPHSEGPFPPPPSVR